MVPNDLFELAVLDDDGAVVDSLMELSDALGLVDYTLCEPVQQSYQQKTFGEMVRQLSSIAQSKKVCLSTLISFHKRLLSNAKV